MLDPFKFDPDRECHSTVALSQKIAHRTDCEWQGVSFEDVARRFGIPTPALLICI